MNLETQKQTKWIEMHQSQVNMCFLRGPLRWLMEQKKQNSFEVCKTHSAIQQFGYKRDFFTFAVTNQNEILGFGDGKVSALLSHSSCKQETVFKLLHNLQNPG